MNHFFMIFADEINILMIACLLKILTQSRQFVCAYYPCGALERVDLDRIEPEVFLIICIFYHFQVLIYRVIKHAKRHDVV